MIKRLVASQGRLIVASLVVMAAGVLLFLLTIPLYAAFGIDTDVIGLMIFTTGLALCIVGIIRQRRPRGWKLAVLVILAAALALPLLPLVASLVYYLITGKPLGG